MKNVIPLPIRPIYFVLLLLLSLSVAYHPAAAHAHATGGSLTADAAVTAGIKYFQDECSRQQALMPELLSAIGARDLSRSIAAYVSARPPYEQIETLANAFPDLDQNIDARPYVFHTGEDDPRFEGFHLIERALYRDQRFDGLSAVARKLSRSVDALCTALQDRPRFDPHVIFAGVIALAFEVPAKKVASEEETWSDLSLMIFRNNYQGIWSQVAPFFETGLVSRAAVTEATKSYARVRDVLNQIDPTHPFDTKKGSARPYSAVGTRQRRMIIEAGYRFAVAMEGVRDDVFATLSRKPEEPEEEEGGEENDVDNTMYKNQVKEGLKHFVVECKKQQMYVDKLTHILSKKQVVRARNFYGTARQPYEQIEVLAGDFLDLDGFIDQRPYALERGELDAGWRGFHQVERALFRDADLDEALVAMGPVKTAVDQLCMVLEDGVNGKGSFSASSSFDGMITLAYEVPAKKISSEEETWSDLSVMIFRENLKGIWSQFEPFKETLPRQVAMNVENKYVDIKNLLQYTVDSGNEFENGTTFQKYSSVPVWERKMISDKFYAFAEALVMAKKALKKKA